MAVRKPDGHTIVAIAAGNNHSLALSSDGTVLAWGRNTEGQLGDGTTTSRTTPVAVRLPDGVTVTDIAAGGDHSLAPTSTGSALAWGGNDFGQLGDGTTTNRTTPVVVALQPTRGSPPSPPAAATAWPARPPRGPC